MARLIEIQAVAGCPSPLVARSGDVLLFRATGGRLESGGNTVEMLGAFVPAVIGDDGSILQPMGLPDTVLVLARRPGRARIAVILGDLSQPPQAVRVSIHVEP